MKKVIVLFVISNIMWMCGSLGVMASELKLLGTLKGEDGTINVYGVFAPEQQQPFDNYEEGYSQVIIENPQCRTLRVHNITNAINMAHFNTHNGEWTGCIVKKIIVK